MVWLRFELLQFWQLPDGYDDRVIDHVQDLSAGGLATGWLAGWFFYCTRAICVISNKRNWSNNYSARPERRG